MALAYGRAPVTPLAKHLAQSGLVADRREALEEGHGRWRLPRRRVQLDDPDVALCNAGLDFEQVSHRHRHDGKSAKDHYKDYQSRVARWAALGKAHRHERAPDDVDRIQEAMERRLEIAPRRIGHEP